MSVPFPAASHYRAHVLPGHVYDGDSLTKHRELRRPVIDLGVHTSTAPEKGLRLFGIDTPELSPRDGTDDDKRAEKQAAAAAREALTGFVARAVELADGYWTVRLRVMGVDKYGRPLVYVFDREGREANKMLLSGGFAVPYSGGARVPWKLWPAAAKNAR